ncbi:MULTISPECIES: flavocytochrome c [unclassified Enterococcus]|uniref:flavocytochrome c n=1 Tax=unclassified Enterococcus TaxID=2608891 RepID=UPI0015538003|nr:MULTISPECIES: flavocytochrome c [unclassified Enterococcus]MBS7577148.1 flavocytochrome c [Enterococcus sp. MMGLQ5-2]MBS7584405.1 flavocytochrome c [Enterococcus sp. MMGLQ5-1]NPD12260.1 flavocytochrome c [Enterococcus sp. MMGLQ5-1]NPD36982.1 flavocytochrome c [Enterococcus sp. MMGLQ5-2]
MKRKLLGIASLLIVASLFLSACAIFQPDKKTSSQSEASSEKQSDVDSGASENTYTDPSELKDSYDIIIVGAGGAGMTAAIEAKDAGMNPVIFEKMPVAGGNTSKSSSGMNASNTKVQKAQGIEDSNDAFYEETLKGGKGTNDKDLLRYFVDHSADAIDWLDQNGIVLDNLTITGGMSQKRTHRPSDGSAIGEYLVNGLIENVHKREIPIFVNADVTSIKENDGTVDGVSVTIQGEKAKTIKSKAVVVTTGGFGANEKLIEKYRPDLKGYVTTNQEGSTGDGITMIEKLGGQVVDMDQIQIHPTVQQDKGILIGEAVRGEGAILVNDEGKRFVNELDTRDKVSAAITALPEKSAYLVFDQGVRDRATAIEFYDKQGYVISGDTIEALAEKMNVPAGDLESTVSTWNTSVANKSDAEFGRTTAMDHDLSTPKYYAIKIAPGIHYTMGGVKINTETQVLNKSNEPIKGLYAAGEVVGGLHGQNRIGGNSVAEIIIFGRQAGIQSAAFAKEQ